MEGRARAKNPDEVFCFSCGAAVKEQAEICVHCGVRLRPMPTPAGYGVKSKTTAILLAIFLGFWTWLYTYREDSGKFWVSVGLNVAGLLTSVATLGAGFVLLAFVGLGIWIWAIVDTVSKPEEWYVTY